MAYGIVEKSQVMAKDNDMLNRSAEYTAEVEDGNVFHLKTVSSTDGEEGIWTATLPATGDLEGLWMVQDFGVNLTDGKYRGLNDDPRNYLVPIGTPFSCFKLKKFDMLLMSVDAFANAKSTNTYANAADGAVQLTWGATQTANATSLKYVETSHFSIGLGSSVTNRLTAYRMQVVAE